METLMCLTTLEYTIETCVLADDIRTDPISNVHYMFGHPSAERTRYICKCYQSKDIRKLEHKAFEFLKNCTYCKQAKGKRNSFTGSVNRPDILGKQWYADVKGPFAMPSLVHGNTYVFGIIEAKSRLLIQFYIKKKSDVESCLRAWYERYIQALRLAPWKDELTHIFLNTDMGECTSNKIISFLNSVGVQLTTTCPHIPEQNMVIERVWRTIGESAIAMLLTANLSEPYWEEARKTACYLYNREPSAHCERDSTSPFEKYFGVKPHVNNLRVFGSICYPTNLVIDKGNHDPKAFKGVFVGYQDQQSVGWRIFLPLTNEFIITAHASFEDVRVRDNDRLLPNSSPAMEQETTKINGSDQSDSLSLPEMDSVMSAPERDMFGLKDGSTEDQRTSVSISHSPTIDDSESLSNTDCENSKSLHLVNPGVKSQRLRRSSRLTPSTETLSSDRTSGSASNHSVSYPNTICTPDGPYLRNHSSRTGVQVKDSRLNDNNISFRADRESDCLSDRSCHPTQKGTDTLSVDKPATKTAKSKRSRQVEFASDSEAISPVNRFTNNLNITEAESTNRAKRKRKMEIPTDTARNVDSGIVSEGRVVKKRFEESSLTNGLFERPLEDYEYLIEITHRDNEDNLLYLVSI